jgi:CRP/FNR family transcriptional regulator
MAKFQPFSFLSRDALESIHRHRRIIKFKDGDEIIRQGTQMTDIISIKSGLGKMFVEGMNGYELILQLIKKGDFILGPGLYTDFKYHYSITAIAPITAVLLDINIFLEMMTRNPQFAKQSQRAENMKKINLLDKFVNLTQKQMTGRIAEVLLYLHESIYKTNPFKMDITRSELGNMTALCKESITRILKQLKKEGVIDLRGKNVEILDMPALRYFSEVG